jgi:alcohol dehydrogenase YqhD (iron-dependent ADH family)
MENFIASNPTSLHFGKNVLSGLGLAAKETGKKALLMYGKGSVLKNGSYNQVIEQLKLHKIEFIEYTGIKSNPVVEDVIEAANIGVKHDVDFIVALGGGSVIDSAKITAIAIAESVDPWMIMKYRHKPKNALPLIAILTLAATGTEMNPVAVLQNHATGEKLGFGNPLIYPKHSFLDPEFTTSVPPSYTAYGIVDLIAHSLEAFFGIGDATLSDRFVEAIIKEAFEYGPKLMTNLNDYDLRAKIMWAATNALNGLTSYGKKSGDWGVHSLGHILSLLYDTPHGASLSIVYPAWLKYMKSRIPERIETLGEHLYSSKDADKTISKMETYFSLLGSPVRLSEIGIDKSMKGEILEQMNKNKSSGMVHALEDIDRETILELMF